MRRRTATVLVLVGLFARRAAGAPPDPAPAPPAPGPAPAAAPTQAPAIPGAQAAAAAEERRRLAAALSSRVADWIRVRKALAPVRCWNCNGRGRIRAWVGTLEKDQECKKCQGTGKTVSDAALKAAYGGMRSPESRSMRDEAVPAGDRDALGLDAGRIDRVEVVDATHGLGWIFENDATTSKSSRWIRVFERAKNAWTWFRYDEAADGPWPLPDASAGTPAPVLGEDGVALEGALADVRTVFRLGARTRVDRSLRIDAQYPGYPFERELPGIVRDDTLALARAILARTGTAWESLRFTFSTPVEDAAGGRFPKPYAVVAISTSALSALPLATMSADAAFAKFTVDFPPLAEGEGRVSGEPAK